ncbi:MAG: response regulator [Bacillota bacterium]
MKILVVDDEQILLDSICLILSKEPDLTVETATTGREAIEKAEIFRPELVLMDLKMPGINGMEALREIRRVDPQAILVILSAYENFIYAQEAIRLNVYDYLVKPINKTRLLELIAKARESLARTRVNRQEELALRERYNKLLPLIENEFIFELINGITEPALHEYQELLALKFNAGFFLAISVYDKTAKLVDYTVELGYLLRQKTEELAEEIRRVITCFITPVKINPISVFVPVGPDLNNGRNSREIALKILNHLQGLKKNAEIKIGVGHTYPCSPELKRSYQEALFALNHNQSQPVFHYDDIVELAEENWEVELNRELQTLLENIKFGNVLKVQLLIQQLQAKYSQPVKDQDRLFFYLLELLLSAYKIGKENSRNHIQLYPSFKQTMTIFNEDADPAIVFQEVGERLSRITMAIKENRDNQVKSIIRQAKEIIDRQFNEQLNLEDLSHQIGISPFYFSRLFREELGISFSEYLTKLRMEKAINLLAQGLSVKECCFSVGYNDPNYFSRIFKKYFDLAPSEYKEEQERLKGGDLPK